MNQIKDPPLNHDFGLEFNYWLWTADTDITLTNVPWNNDMRDVVWFDTTSALNAYIDSHDSDNAKIANSMYAKADQPIQIDMPFNLANRYNYVRVYNPAQPISGDVPKYFYYFITNVRYIAPNNTEIMVQLDVFQTYIRQVQFGKCYIERGHIGVANQAHFRNNGRDFLTIPEGIDLGSEYMTVGARVNRVMGVKYGDDYDVVVASTVKLDGISGDESNPRLESATGSKFMGVQSGANYYLFTAASFQAFLQSMSSKPWITQGIISATAVPNLGRYYFAMDRSQNAIGAMPLRPDVPQPTVYSMWNNWRYSVDITNYIPPRYRRFRKFWTYPYMVIEVTSFNGTPVILKPEAWNSPHASIREFASFLVGAERIVFSPAGYNARYEYNEDINGSTNNQPEYEYDQGEHLDLFTQITNLPKIPVVNNGALSYLAANAHSIAYAHQSADWAQQRAVRGAEVSYDQAMSGIGAVRAQTEAGNQYQGASLGIQQNLERETAAIRGIGGTLFGGARGLAAGPTAAATGAASAAGGGMVDWITMSTQQSAAQAQLGAAVNQNWRSTDIANNQSQYVADTNKGLAQWAARGDYENSIAAINAKTQDAQLTPPSISGQMGGEYIALLTNNMGLIAKWKMIDQAAIAAIGEYWLRYGYAVRRSSFLPPNLQVMSKFTYWKLQETYIRAAPIPEGFKQIIRGIFEKGVTVWADPDDIGVIDWADNDIIPGIELDNYDPPLPPIEPPPTPEPKKTRKAKRMLVYNATIGGTPTWALAGTSPGTAANWIETTNSVRALAFVKACGVDDAVTVSDTDFALYKNQYISPVTITAGADIPVGGRVEVTGLSGGPVITETAP